MTPEDRAWIIAAFRQVVREELHPSARAETNVVPLRRAPLSPSKDQPDEPPPPIVA